MTRGRPKSELWALLTDEENSHKAKQSVCKHCHFTVVHRQKTERVRLHLEQCIPFKSKNHDLPCRNPTKKSQALQDWLSDFMNPLINSNSAKKASKTITGNLEMNDGSVASNRRTDEAMKSREEIKKQTPLKYVSYSKHATENTRSEALRTSMKTVKETVVQITREDQNWTNNDKTIIQGCVLADENFTLTQIMDRIREEDPFTKLFIDDEFQIPSLVLRRSEGRSDIAFDPPNFSYTLKRLVDALPSMRKEEEVSFFLRYKNMAPQGTL